MSQRKEGCSRGQASRHWPPALPGRVGWRGGLLPSEASRGGTARAPVGKGSLPWGMRPQYGCQGHASGPATHPLLRLLLGPCTHRRGGKGKPSSTTFHLKATLQQSLGARFPKNPHSGWVQKQPAVSPSCRLPPTSPLPAGSWPIDTGAARSWGGVSHSGMPATARGGRDGLQFVFIVTKEHFPKVPTNRSIYIFIFIFIYI